MKGPVLLLLCFCCSWSWAQSKMGHPLLGQPVDIFTLGEKGSDILLYNMHDNENTSALAGRFIALHYKGEHFELLHTGRRHISFAFGKDSVHLDPNRIYTDAGVWAQLVINKKPDTLLLRVIGEWRDSLLSILKIHERQLVVALHNNTDLNYSIESYLHDGVYANEAFAVYRGMVDDPDDFYFVTEFQQLEKLTQGRYHVVLQSNDNLTDDGSLSVYCAGLGIPYVNVEAQHGHLLRQIRMLVFALRQLAASHG